MTRRSRITGSSGFTLVEIVIAAAIVAALAAIAVPVFRAYRERAILKCALADLLTLQAAIDRDITEFGRVPNSIDHLPESKKLDPWGHAYRYLNVSPSAPVANSGLRRKDKNLVPINSDYDLYSLGPDGQTKPPLTAPPSHDDLVRANDGAYLGRAADY